MGETIQVAVAQAGGGDIGGFLVMMVAMFAIFYFLLIRPQRKQQLEHQNLLASLKKGDEVVLSSGLFGKIFAVEDKTVTVEIAQNTRVKVLKQAVTGPAQKALSGPAAKQVEAKGDKPAAEPSSEKSDGEPEAGENGEDKSAKSGKKGGKRPSA